jgi:hypothetical protein
MAGTIKIKGLENVMANLNKEIKAIEGRTTVGLIEGSILIRRDMDKTSPKIPVDLGNLRASYFTVTTKKGGVASLGGVGLPFKGKEGSKMQGERMEAITESRGVLSAVKIPSLIMGFSANYATFNHENVGANFKRPGAGAKFFESAIKRNSGKVIKIIQMNAIIKK